MVANSVIQGVFGANLKEFFTGRTGTSTIYNPNQADSIITLPEMLGIDQMGLRSGRPAVYKQVNAGVQLDTIKSNLKNNSVEMITQVIAIPLAFRLAKKFLGKPVINPANKMLRTVGIKEVKV
jgi:hypothetical protein